MTDRSFAILPGEPEPKRRFTSPPDVPLRRLRRADLPEDTVALARYLIGCAIVSDAAPARTVARIVETEAYLPGDAAAHSFRGETARNRSLFLRRGHAYVYFIYGNHYCLNVSSEREGVGAGVLLRAGEPLAGIETMRLRRPATRERDLCRGPGRLAAALGIGKAQDGADLTVAGSLWLARGRAPDALGESVRIGLSKEAERVLRFFRTRKPVSQRNQSAQSLTATRGADRTP